MTCVPSKLWKGTLFLFLLGIGALSFYPFFVSQEKEDENKDLEPSNSKKSYLAQFFNLPLYFEKNEGQIDVHFQYLTRLPGHTFCFSPEGVSVLLKNGYPSKTLSVLNIQFLGGNPQPIIEGLDEQECKSNYFIGQDASKWYTGISTYNKIAYKNLYPGIDVLFYGNAKQLEYDFLVDPGVNPNHIRMRIEGAKKLNIDSEGDLQIVVENDEEQIFQMKKPVIYQMVEGNKVDVEGKFILLAKQEVGLSLGNYDTTRQLVIDPILTYSTYLGGTENDVGLGISIDRSGYAYVVGFTNSFDFPTTAGAFQTSKGGITASATNAFLTKMNTTGTALVYSTYLGGSTTTGSSTVTTQANSVAVDNQDNAYVTGFTNTNNFPTTTGAFQPSIFGAQDAFVTKINSTGSALIYSTYLGGGPGNTSANCLVVDEGGHAYVTGYTSAQNFPTTSGAFQTSKIGPGEDAFITKFNPSGSALIYSTYLGGLGRDQSNSIVVDKSGNAYVTGNTGSMNFPTTSGAFQTSNRGTVVNSTFASISNGFITKLNSSGSALDYSTYLGGTGWESSNEIQIDEVGNAYVAGVSISADFPTTLGAYQTTLNGTQNGFVTKLNPTGTALIYSTYLGGSGSANQCTSLALDAQNNAYVTGFTNSVNFPVTTEAIQSSLSGVTDAFISKLDFTGTSLLYSTYMGGTSNDSGVTITTDTHGNAYVVGATGSTNFPTTTGAFQTAKAGGLNDAFVAKLAIGSPVVTSVSPQVGPITGGTVVKITGMNFTLATAVYFGEALATTFVVDSDTQITVLSPEHALGTVDIRVEAIGVSPPTLVDQFTYQLLTTTTSLAISPNPARADQTMILTATVFPSSATGSVTFFDGIKLLGVAPLSNGKASFITDSLSVGNHSIIASYSGDNVNLGSSSQIVKFRVSNKRGKPKK